MLEGNKIIPNPSNTQMINKLKRERNIEVQIEERETYFFNFKINKNNSNPTIVNSQFVAMQIAAKDETAFPPLN